MGWFYNLNIKSKLLLSFLFIAVITAFVGYIGYSSSNKIHLEGERLYQETTVPLGQLQRVTASFGVIRIRIREMFTAKSEKDLKTFSKSIDKEIDSMKILSGLYEGTFIDKTDQKNWEEFKDAYEKYIVQIKEIRSLLFQNKMDEALDYMNVTSKPLAVLSRNNLDKVVDYNIIMAAKISDDNKTNASSTENLIIIIIIISVLLAVGLGLFIANTISRPIKQVMERLDSLESVCLANLQKGAEEFASGNLDIKIITGTQKLQIDSKDETGQLAVTLNRIIDKTVASIDSVENVTKTVILMTKEINAIVDAAVKGDLTTRGNPDNFEGGFKEIINGLNNTLDAIVGPLNVAAEYVDRISKGEIPKKITKEYYGDFNELKENLNTCIDAVNLLITDSNMLAQAAVEGILSSRADSQKHFGDFRKIIQGVNDTLDAVTGPLGVAAGYIDNISKGEIPPKISENYKGDFNVIKNNLNTCIDSLNELISAMITTTDLQKAGDLEAFADESGYKGVYKSLIQGYNEGMRMHIKNVLGIVDLLKHYSEGDLSAELPPLPGKQIIATERVNLLRKNVLNLVRDTVMLSEAASNGDFEKRADEKLHAGDFAKIISGINNTLDTVVDKVFWFEGLLDSIPMPVSVTDLNMKWTFINKPVEDFLNIKRKDVLGKHCSNWNAAICNTEDCGVAGLRRNKLQTMFAQLGMNFQVDTSYILNRKGEKIGHIEVVQDITKRVKTDNYSKTEVERLASNLKLLSEGNLMLDLAVAEGDEFTKQEKQNFQLINESLGEAKNAINQLVTDAEGLAHAAVEGNLSDRADTNKHSGDYKKIVEGINNTLEAIITPIKEGVTVLEKMAQGDLTVRISSEYKGDHQLIKNSINSVAGSLNTALSDVSEAVEATASASNQISSSTEEMAAGSHEQTQQTSEVASGVEEMTKTILENTKNATHAADAAKEAGNKAKAGGKVVTETIAGMNKIAEVVKKSAETVQELGKSSDQIGEIVQVINDIADQTNLLALNAAIEAARAGEQGRGFAVVADEVRKLAERTTKATKEIATMIRQIQKDTSNAVNSMEEGTKEVERGKALANKAGVSLHEIVDASQVVLDIIAQVAAASEEQSTTAEQISRNIEAISSVAQESSAGTQQIAKAAEDLTRLTLNLENLVERFKLNDSFEHRHGEHLKNKKKHVTNKGHKGFLQ